MLVEAYFSSCHLILLNVLGRLALEWKIFGMAKISVYLLSYERFNFEVETPVRGQPDGAAPNGTLQRKIYNAIWCTSDVL